jgi:hypothetical protein
LATSFRCPENFSLASQDFAQISTFASSLDPMKGDRARVVESVLAHPAVSCCAVGLRPDAGNLWQFPSSESIHGPNIGVELWTSIELIHDLTI